MGAAQTGGGVAAAGSTNDDAVKKCMHDQGIVAWYTSYLPAGMLWPLRVIVTGICVLLATLFLALAAFRLRAAPRSAR